MANTNKARGRLPQGMHFDESRGYYVKRFTVDGKRYTVYGKTKKECLDKETDKRQKISDGLYIKNNAITLNDYFGEWVNTKSGHVKGSTLYNYKKNYLNHIKKYIGHRKIQDIERREIIELHQRIVQNNGASVANHVKILINGLLKSALYDGIIKSNPADNIRNIKTDGGRRMRETSHRALTEEEIKVFLNAAKKSWYYNTFRFLLATGLRIGECGALKWGDIDFKNHVIHIRRTVTRDKDGVWIIGDTPKTVSSERDIPINGEIMNILQSQRDMNIKLHGNIIPLDGLIFTKENGGIIVDNVVNSIIANIVNKINKKGGNLERFSLHAFRDTFASMAYRKGVPMNVLKELMGHSSYQMTADIYGHIYNEQKIEAMQKIDKDVI